MNRFRYAVFTFTLILALLLGETPLRAAPDQQGRRDLVACTAVDEAHLLDELNRVTQAVFADALARIDVAAVVDRQWTALNMENTLHGAVDQAIPHVQGQTELWETFLSGWSAEKAKQLTEAVAAATFDAPAFRTAMDGLSSAVAADIASQIGALSAESVSAGLYCLQTFIKANHSQALLASFEEKVEVATSGEGLNAEGLAPSLLDVVGQHKVALGGVGVIIAAQITKRIVTSVATRISERVAGRIAGRILGRVGSTVIPLAGWIIGIGLLAYDIYDSLDGALPQIQESLKSPEAAAAIRAEVAATIEPELRLELPTIAREIANDLHSQWLAVKRDIRVVLELAAESDAFAHLLQRTESSADLAQLVAVVGAALPAVGRDGVIAAAESGVLQRVATLPSDPSPIVAATGSLENAAAWGDVAGALLDEVIAAELYKHLAPEKIDRSLLVGLLALDDPTAVARLALLPAEQMHTLLAISTANLAVLARTFTPDQLSWLAETLATLDQPQRNALIARLVSEPQTLALIQQSNILAALSPGVDFDAAIAFLAGPRDLIGLVNDANQVVAGDASFRLFTMKYGWGVTLLTGLAFLLLILVALRMIYALAAWLLAPVTGIMGRGR